jgi:CRISPR-associated endonuclease/helicase Cas3
MNPVHAAFWAKAHPLPGAAAAFHPLVAHCLDVAAVALLLPSRQAFGLDARVLGFLVALHDIGKISRPFQAKECKLWPEAALGAFPAVKPPAGPGHDAFGLFLLHSDGVTGALRQVLPGPAPGQRGWTHGHAGLLWRALAGHHGRPPEPMITPPFATALCDGCRASAVGFVQAMREVFQPPPLPRPRAEHDVMRLAWHLAGVTTLADWIGSRQAWFPYVPVEAVADPAGYFYNRALPQAAAALAAAGLAHAEPAPFGGMRRLFPRITVPSPVQDWAQTVDLPEGPVLAVIEDLTGSGKTEAAVTLAHRLLAAGRAQGVYVALPTMATANAMYGRMADAYRGLFVPEARPSLTLAHGRADLDPRFRAALAGDAVSSPVAADPADDPAEAHCAAWLAEDRRRALLAQVGVGTLDQALLAALPVRHATLRLHGLAAKVLIVDEAHAFDPYMRHELLALLRFQAALGGSAIVLSATLPRATRQELTDAFRDGLDAPPETLCDTRYPLATLVTAGGVTETACGVREGLARRVAVTRLDDVAAALERVVAAAKSGAAVAWVRNTVDDAIAAAAALRARGLEPLLFHARFAMADRLKIEAEVLRRFGRDSAGEARRGVLVATPIIEQSLDLDFDVMCTDLAPADLLIQRAGRLWRHERERPPVAARELLVVSPDPVDDPKRDWIAASLPGTAAVYRDPALLWRGARAVFGRGAITTPEDMRDLIEAAADMENVPPALARPAAEAEGKTLAQVGIAEQNVLDVWRGYDRAAGLWEPDTRTPTRLEDRPQVTLRLARLREGTVVPYVEDADPRRAWALSEVTVARFRIAACPVPAETEAAAAEARKQWGRWERDSDRVLLALLTEAEGGTTLAARAESGAAVTVAYSARRGLEWLPARGMG